MLFRSTVNSYCITPEEAEEPGSDMFAGTKKGECKYDSFKMGGGKLDAVMSCASPGGEMHATMTGTYSATSYDMTMAMDMNNSQMPGGGMKMKVRTTGERTGECKPGDQ